MAESEGPFIRIEDVIKQAREQGCELRTAKFQVIDTDGSRRTVRFLYNPKTGGTFDVTGYNEGEALSPALAAAAERRLGITLMSYD